MRSRHGLGTGAVQWQSGTALAQALLDSSDLERLVASKRVLELGCGCAALPATISAIKDAASVVATDVAALMPLVLANLREYGQTPGMSDANKHALASTLEVRPLDWTSEEEVRSLAADARGFDLVLCADCVDESEALLRALADVISASGALVSGLIGQTEGTIYAKVDLRNWTASGRVLAISDGTSDARVVIQVGANRTLQAVVTAASGEVANIATASGQVNGVYTCAVA